MKKRATTSGTMRDFTTADILRAMRRAHRSAVKTARLHKVPLVYLKNGKLVREIP